MRLWKPTSQTMSSILSFISGAIRETFYENIQVGVFIRIPPGSGAEDSKIYKRNRIREPSL